MFPPTGIIFSGDVNQKIQVYTSYLFFIVANALPVYGAATGRLVFFQVIYLYWLESLILIFFDDIRIMTARGTEIPEKGIIQALQKTMIKVRQGNAAHWTFFRRLGLAFRVSFIRVSVLLFYMIFIVVFIVFQLTAKEHRHDTLDIVLWRNPFFNLSVITFIINATVQLLNGFYLNGTYKTESPLSYTAPFDGRTMMLHVMIVISVFIHHFLFEGKSYASLGEIVYIGLFMIVKTVSDLRRV